uniref:Uncharacterized protein AlNc14C147G7423 n=1 Tax=Albugo laibachii Nc14 TaxID=890382 RepID=F0WLN5_9STRA|nr:conserved hypothetical protein [Albugo laibachii Nc14]|eukprot:CCA22201.1 conserved hypothetical protein [Albugo laibachii Nc14]
MAPHLSTRVLRHPFRCVSPCLRLRFTHEKTTCLFSMQYAFNHTQSPSKKVNLVRIMSPFILCLHPDTCRHISAKHAAIHEDTLKQLNSFISIASLGCNSDIKTLQERLQTASILRNQSVMRFPLAFYASESDGHAPLTTECIRYTITVPSSLLRYTLAAESTQSISHLAQNWRKTTKKILDDLSLRSGIAFADVAQLQEERENAPDFAQLGCVSRHNRRQYRQVKHQSFRKEFDKALRREKPLIHPKATGREDVPLHRHSILHSLLSERLRIDKEISASLDGNMEKDRQYRVFAWIANMLLIHFQQLGLHQLVWNKISLLITCPCDSMRIPQVVYNLKHLRDGVTLVIPFEMETETLIQFLMEHSQKLAIALATPSK